MSASIIAIKEQQLAQLARDMKPGHLGIAHGLVAGKSQATAYTDAGYISREAASRASEMIRLNPPIGWYVELAKEISVLKSQAKLIGTTEQKREILWRIITVCSDFASLSAEELEEAMAEGKNPAGLLVDPNTSIRAMNELNKMDGGHAAVKNELSGPNGGPIKTESAWIIEGVAPGMVIEGELVADSKQLESRNA
jgi:hypothetical protein